MIEPLTPLSCDLRDFPFMPIYAPRLFSSEFHALSDDAAWRAGVTLWLRSWHQVPAASLPADDIALARLADFGKDVKGWRRVKEAALRGWHVATDGRLYHRVVAESALESWLEKLLQRISSGAGNAKRWKTEFDATAIEGDIDEAVRLLTMLNPNSRALTKLRRRQSRRDNEGDPTGNAGAIPLKSQETGTGTGTRNHIVVDECAGDASEGERVPLVPDPGAGLDVQLQAVCRRAGISLDPTRRRWADELTRLKGWLDDGYRLEEDIFPAIDRTLERLPVNETISALRFIERELFTAGARARVAKARKPREAVPVETVHPGESDRAQAFRAAMLKALGGGMYGAWFKPVSIVDRGEDGLEVRAGNAFVVSRLEAEYRYQMDLAAGALGIPPVVIRVGDQVAA